MANLEPEFDNELLCTAAACVWLEADDELLDSAVEDSNAEFDSVLDSGDEIVVCVELPGKKLLVEEDSEPGLDSVLACGEADELCIELPTNELGTVEDGDIELGPVLVWDTDVEICKE